MATPFYRVRLDLAVGALELVEKATTIGSMLKDNPLYPDLQTKLGGLADARDALETLNTEVQFNGGKVDYERRRAAETALRVEISKVGALVQVESNGDKAAILSAGFDVWKKRERITTVDPPRNFNVQRTVNLGELELSWRRSPGALLFNVERRNADGTWSQIANTTRTRLRLTGQASGEPVALRLIAIGSAGFSEPSEIVECQPA